MHCQRARFSLQAARNRWRPKSVKRGAYTVPSRVLLCKLTHHVGSALHVPQQRGGTSSACGTATLALCQCHARCLLQSTEHKGTWLLMLGATCVDSKYSQEYMHGQAAWKKHVSGRILAAAKVDSVLEPAGAKARFGPDRADTGCLLACLHSSSLVVCLFRIAAKANRKDSLQQAQEVRTSDEASHTRCPGGILQNLLYPGPQRGRLQIKGLALLVLSIARRIFQWQPASCSNNCPTDQRQSC